MDDDLRRIEDAERAMRELVAARQSLYQPLDHVLDGPCLRVYSADLPLAMRLGRADNGRLICTGLLVGWTDDRGEVGPRALHSIPLQSVLSSVARLAERARTGRDVTVAPVGVSGRYTDDDFARIADLHRQALLVSPGSPVVWMAQAMGVSHATAARLLVRCRDRGMIP